MAEDDRERRRDEAADRDVPEPGEASPDESSRGQSSPDESSPVEPGTEEPGPEEMDLDELRREIRSIDREIVELIAQRTYVADSIAAVKRERGLPVTDEDQEAEVMERAGENAERFDVDANLVKAIFRLLIELNKVEQRESR